MAYYQKYQRAIFVVLPMLRGRVQCFEFMHTGLKQMHRFALEKLELSPEDFEVDQKGCPHYWMPISKQSLALHHGATAISYSDDEAAVLRANLALQLSNTPDMGQQFALNYELECEQELEAERVQKAKGKAKRLAFLTSRPEGEYERELELRAEQRQKDEQSLKDYYCQ